MTEYSAVDDSSPVSGEPRLRDIVAADLPSFFEQQRDPDANHMVAFTVRDPSDRAAFMAHWADILADASTVKQTILCDGEVAGNIVCFEHNGKREVGYWLGKP